MSQQQNPSRPGANVPPTQGAPVPPGQPHGQVPPQYAPAPGQPAAAPAPKRSWFARHKVLSGIGALVLVLILFSLLNPKGGKDEAAAPEQQATTSGAEATAPATKASAPATEAKKEEKKTGVALGETGKDGDAELTVTEWTCGLGHVGSDAFGKEAQGQYCQATVTVKNTGKKALTWFASNQRLKDSAGAEFKTSDDAIYLEDANVFEEINPGNTMKGLLLFDIPQDAAPTTLVLHESMFSKGLTVAIG